MTDFDKEERTAYEMLIKNISERVTLEAAEGGVKHLRSNLEAIRKLIKDFHEPRQYPKARRDITNKEPSLTLLGVLDNFNWQFNKLAAKHSASLKDHESLLKTNEALSRLSTVLMEEIAKEQNVPIDEESGNPIYDPIEINRIRSVIDFQVERHAFLKEILDIADNANLPEFKKVEQIKYIVKELKRQVENRIGLIPTKGFSDTRILEVYKRLNEERANDNKQEGENK